MAGSMQETMANMSDEERGIEMKKWFDWNNSLVEKDILVSGGEPLSPGKVINGNEKTVTDGFVSDDMNKTVGVYYLIKADSIDEALEIAKGCPVFENNGTIEVREVASMPGQ